MHFKILTIFPHIFDSYFGESIIKRAREKKKIKIDVYNLRDWTSDRHKTVDDKPYGGGAGMVMKAEPIIQAVKSVAKSKKKRKIILLSAKGKTWDQKMAKKFSSLEEIVLICGRYEGVDERVKKICDEEISIGNYVLTGGEIPAMIIVDSITRLLPGVLGNEESAKYESHAEEGLLEYPHYTRPEVISINKKNYRVPKVLLSGDHKKIEEWRKKRVKSYKVIK